MSSQASELARNLADAWARYENEMLASVDARCGDLPRLSSVCNLVHGFRVLLAAAVETGEYWRVPSKVRKSVGDLTEHVKDRHPEYWHLFFEDAGPAATALRDQLDACRREAAEQYGPK